MRKTALFFGSFNPIHVGHLIIANTMLQQEDVDEVWLVVSPQNPLKERATLLADHHRLQMVRRLMDTLPEKQRTCIQLRDVEGKAYKDIATVLGITEQQVKVNIFRARQTIKKKFTENDEYGL